MTVNKPSNMSILVQLCDTHFSIVNKGSVFIDINKFPFMRRDTSTATPYTHIHIYTGTCHHRTRIKSDAACTPPPPVPPAFSSSSPNTHKLATTGWLPMGIRRLSAPQQRQTNNKIIHYCVFYSWEYVFHKMNSYIFFCGRIKILNTAVDCWYYGLL